MQLEINKESLLMELPIGVFWKNIDGTIIGANKAFAKLVGAKSVSQVEGLSDRDAPWAEYAEVYHKHDLDAYNGLRYTQLELMRPYHGDQFASLTEKKPLFDAFGCPCGVIGTITVSKGDGVISLLGDLNKTTGLDKKSTLVVADETYFYSNQKLGKLTSREIECLYYLLRGHTAKAIALRMKISYRTVEKHLEAIKVKFNCRHKSEIIALAEKNKFFHFIPKNIFNMLVTQDA